MTRQKKHKVTRQAARKFWRYMKENNKVLGTRTELRNLYKNHFLPTLSDDSEKAVHFADILWTFRTALKIIEWQPPSDRENIIYRKGKRVAVDQAYVLKREGLSEDNQRENLGGFNDLKKKLVDER